MGLRAPERERVPWLRRLRGRRPLPRAPRRRALLENFVRARNLPMGAHLTCQRKLIDKLAGRMREFASSTSTDIHPPGGARMGDDGQRLSDRCATARCLNRLVGGDTSRPAHAPGRSARMVPTRPNAVEGGAASHCRFGVSRRDVGNPVVDLPQFVHQTLPSRTEVRNSTVPQFLRTKMRPDLSPHPEPQPQIDLPGRHWRAIVGWAGKSPHSGTDAVAQTASHAKRAISTSAIAAAATPIPRFAGPSNYP